MSPPARVVWIEMLVGVEVPFPKASPPARVVWIEIAIISSPEVSDSVATREGGVD